MSEFPIDTRGLRKSFKDHQVLNGVDLKIPPGSVVGGTICLTRRIQILKTL
jgi:ABC-type transporter Mla maintaining outer membrane lipid asymmetry ATPase subunit MlaF